MHSFFYNRRMNKLDLRNVCVQYGDYRAVQDISLSVQEQECFVIVGESGCGKTTLLRAIAGLLPVSGGTIWMDGTEITNRKPAQRNMAMVFQDGALFEHVNVKQNILYGSHQKPKKEVEDRMLEVCRILHIDTLLQRYPASLSSGQKQRVGIARALVQNPSILLLDEPFSNLDQTLKVTLQKELLQLKDTYHMTMLFVTHDQQEAFRIADRIAFVKEGQLIEIGTPKSLIVHPGKIETARFIGTRPMNLINREEMTQLEESKIAQVGIRSNWFVQNGKEVGTVTEKITLEDGFRYLVAWKTQTLWMDFEAEYETGQTIMFGWDTNRMVLFDADGQNIESVGCDAMEK